MAARHDSPDAQAAARDERRAARARRIDCAPAAEPPRSAAPPAAPAEQGEPRREDVHAIRTRRHA